MTRGQRAGGGEGKWSVRVGSVGTARAGALRLDGAAGGHGRGGGARRTVPERDPGQGRTREALPPPLSGRRMLKGLPPSLTLDP